MYLAFIDESGFAPNWRQNIESQPYFVMSATIFNASDYRSMSKSIRDEVEDILPNDQIDRPLGKGFEIKASDISNGRGFWSHNTDERNDIRELMLNSPSLGDSDSRAICIVIDKERHDERYVDSKNPYLLSFEMLLNRVDKFFSSKEETGICVFDQNKRKDDDIHEWSMNMIRDGREIILSNSLRYNITLENTIELYLGNSDNSIGLQIADFFAHFTYKYYQGGKPNPCGWWDTLCDNLDTDENGEMNGYGLKEHPA